MIPKFCTSCGYIGRKPDITGLEDYQNNFLSTSIGCLVCIFGDEAIKFINGEKE